VALLTVLLTVALLTVTVMEFTYATQVDYRRAAHWLKARQASLIAESMVLLATQVLVLDGQFSQTDGLQERWAQLCQRPDNSCSPVTEESSCAADVGGVLDLPYGAVAALRITDVQGLYNLNRLASPSQTERERFGRLLRARRLDPALAGPIIDWIDADAKPLAYPPGAEAEIYAARTPPYVPRNGPMMSFRELALVAGVGTDELRALRGVADALPTTADKINVNTAPRDVLRALDQDLDDDALLDRIHEARCAAPFTSWAEMQRIPGMQAVAIGPLIGFKSDYFRIEATAGVEGIYQSVEALVHRTGLRVDILYYLPRRGPIIPGVDMSEATSLNDLDLLAVGRAGG
jgi:general secretion pathway protein K